MSNFSLSAWFKNPLYRFLLGAMLFYIGWYLLYELWLHPFEVADLWVVKFTMGSAKQLLNLIGFSTFEYKTRLIGIDGAGGLWMGDSCDSIELCAIFSGFIIAFPGLWKDKLWYLPLGWIIITSMNIMRVVLLAIIQRYFSKSILEFNHTYTFNAIVYGVICLLWYLWVKRSSKTTSIFKQEKTN